jgi:hypothetical protein
MAEPKELDIMHMYYCPTCSEPFDAQQKFCRKCGFSLKELSPSATETPSKIESDELRLGRQLKKVIGAAILCFFVWFLILISSDVPIFDPDFGKLLRYLGTLIFAIGCLLILYAGARQFFVWQFHESDVGRDSGSSKPRATEKDPIEDLVGEKALKQARFESMPSVTEGTTEPLLAEKQNSAKKA